ncbi:hypothetical protein M422DRAFT_63059 [Sphaerobolus stellatus SS14]|nr:hypothetical protein M422DRAFT_63059 [Sphaerobolus stellatus SS14]
MMDSSVQACSRRLPVPQLRQTLDKYLKSIIPFLEEDESNGGPKAEHELAKRALWARDFETGIGRVLQNRLIALDEDSPHNWLEDNFWMKHAYLSSRTPLLVNSNFWCLCPDDPIIPKLDIRDGEFTFWQVRRAAWLLKRALEYRERVERKVVKSFGKSTPYQLPFHCTRTPHVDCDTLASLPSRADPGSKRITLMLRNYMYSLQVVDKDEKSLSVSKLEELIWTAINDVKSMKYEANPVGILTTENRDKWAKARAHFLTLSPRNALSLEAVESSILILSLDDYTRQPATRSQTSSLKDLDLDSQVLNCASGMNGNNRWFDKCLSFFVESSGRAGGMGEHSPCDGLVMGHLISDALAESINPDAFSYKNSTDTSQASTETKISLVASPESISGLVDRLEWVVDKQIKAWCVDAEKKAKALSEDSDASMLVFKEFGSGWVKCVAGLSPDAFVQMALQLAYFRRQDCFTATYETAATYTFIHGRTEAVRVFSKESREFVLGMSDPLCPKTTRKGLLLSAVRAHRSYIQDASRGHGIDRHFLGLRLLMKEDEHATIFEDPLFTTSETWKLSTSGLPNGERFAGTGFGSPYTDGYGVQYLISSDIIKFGVESKHSCITTSTEGFKQALVGSLLDMRNLYYENESVDS